MADLLAALGITNGATAPAGLNSAYLDGLAQLETRRGAASVPGTNNLYNIKDFSGGGVQAHDSAEGSNDRYRVFDTPEDSTAALMALLGRKYPAALTAKSPAEFAQALKDGGYATDPDYVKKLVGVISSQTGDSAQPSEPRDLGLLGRLGVHPDQRGQGAAPTGSGDQFADQVKALATQAEAERQGSITGNFTRGVKVAAGQLLPLAQGTVGLAGAAAEQVFGEGGISTAVKNWGLLGAQDGMKKLEPMAKPDDDVMVAFQHAKEGSPSALLNYIVYQAGYGAMQMAVGAASGIVGGAIGTAVAGPGVGTAVGAVEGAASSGLIRKATLEWLGPKIAAAAAKITAADTAKALTAEQVTTMATKQVAQHWGQGLAMFGHEAVMEAGSIYPDAEEQATKDGRKLDGGDIARVIGSTAVAAFIGGKADQLGLDAITGKVRVPGAGGRIARGFTGGLIGGAGEAAEEGAQTVVERFGAGQSMNDDAAWHDYINSAAGGFVPGHIAGTVSGALHAAAPKVATPAPTPVQAAEMQRIQAATDLGNAVTDPNVNVDQAIAMSAALATRPTDDSFTLAAKARGQAERDSLETEAKAKADQVRLEKLQAATDLHAEMVAAQNALTPPTMSADGRLTSPETPAANIQPYARTSSHTDLANPEVTPTPLMKAKTAGVLETEAQRSDAREAAGMAPSPTALTSMPSKEPAVQWIDKTPITNVDEARKNLAQLRERAPEFNVNPNDMVLAPHPDVPGAMAVRTVPDTQGTNKLRISGGDPATSGLSTARSQPITASSPDKYTGNVRFADLTPMSKQQADHRLDELRAQAATTGADADAFHIVPHPGNARKFAIKNTAAPFVATQTTGVKVDKTLPTVDAVKGYVDAKRRENTPAARAFVQDYEAGRINRQDVMRAMAADANVNTDTQIDAESRGLVAEAPGKARGTTADRTSAQVDGNIEVPPHTWRTDTTPSAHAWGSERPDFMGPQPKRGVEAGPARAAPNVEPTAGASTAGPVPTGQLRAPGGMAVDLAKLKVNNNSSKQQALLKKLDLPNIVKNLAQSNNPLVRYIAQLTQDKLIGKVRLVSGARLGSGTRGSFSPGDNSVKVNPANAARREQTMTHELTHALTYQAIAHPTAEQKPIVDALAKLQRDVMKELGPKLYHKYFVDQGRNYLHEFMSEGFTNADFQAQLAAIKYENKTVWGKFTELVAQLLGIKDSSAFTEFMALGEKLMDTYGSGRASVSDREIMHESAAEKEHNAADGTATTPRPGRAHAADVDGQRYADALAARLTKPGAPDVVLRAVTPTGRQDLRAAQVLASRVFGKPVVFVQFGSKPLFNGAALGNTVFLNVDATRPALAVVGHELLHTMQHSQPALYENLRGTLSKLITGESDYADIINQKRTDAGLPAITDTNVMTEEMIADIVGDHFTEPAFWKAMGAEQPKGFAKVVDAVLKFLDDTIASVTKLRPFGTEKYLTDLQASRLAVAQAMREFSGDEVGAVSDDAHERLSVPDSVSQTNADRYNGRRVTYPVHIEDTGETAHMTVDAGSALDDYQKRISAMEELTRCLGG